MIQADPKGLMKGRGIMAEDELNANAVSHKSIGKPITTINWRSPSGNDIYYNLCICIMIRVIKLYYFNYFIFKKFLRHLEKICDFV